jgi:uncharacterized membrane protein SirB2
MGSPVRAMDYTTVKFIHQSAVVVSFAGFFARGIGALREAAWVRGRAARRLPHLVDTVLLASAIALAWMLRLSPLDAPWLLAKIIGLLLYIGLGMLALKPLRPAPLRVTAFVAALVTFAYIVSVAVSKDPAGLLAWIG